MANFILRVGLFSSPRWLGLSCAECQLFFIRIMGKACDAYGCADGRIEVIANQCFPTKVLTSEELGELEAFMHELHRAGLIIRYSNAGRPYIAIPQWNPDNYRRSRKFPAPPINVDLPSYDEDGNPKTVRGIYGKKVLWRNPPGPHDAVSILLDLDGRPVVPQPQEWRNVSGDFAPLSHYAPVTAVSHDYQAVTAPVTVQAVTEDRAVVTAEVGSRKGLEGNGVKALESKELVTAAQSLPKAAVNGHDGPIRFENGEIVGVTEAQLLSWQETFFQLAVRDQIARAQTFLRADAKTLAFWQSQPDGISSFLVRWMLRETKDAQVLPHTGSAS